jgi:hypothetical protein
MNAVGCVTYVTLCLKSHKSHNPRKHDLGVARAEMKGEKGVGVVADGIF